LRGILSYLAKKFENQLARSMNGIVTADDVLAKRFFPYNSNVISIHNYPLLQSFPLTEEKKGFMVSSLGGVYNERCADILIEASKQLKDIVINIGGGCSPSYFDKSWESISCRHIGRLNFIEVNKYYADSDVLIVMFSDAPNHQDIKSNRLYESLYAGKPVIVSNMPKWSKFIHKYRCGIAINPSSPSDLVDAINFMESNPSIAKEMGKRGREAVLKHFSWNSQENKLIRFYNELLLK